MIAWETRYLGYFIGFIFGLYTFELLVDVDKVPERAPVQTLQVLEKHDNLSYDVWLEKKGFIYSQVDQDQLSFGENKYDLETSLESHLLYKFVHITCVVFITKPENAYTVSNTWGRHCNSLLFYSNNITKLSYIDSTVIHLKSSWQFMCECIRNLWLTQKHLQWAVFSYDDVYVIPENLRYFLAVKDFNKPHYYGHNVRFWNLLYNSAQTSFVLSIGSIQALVNKFQSSLSCEKSGRYMNNGDYYLGKYLKELNISAGNALDEEGKERFHILKLQIMLMDDSQNIIKKYSKKSVREIKAGMKCCSDTTISFPTSGENLLTHYLIHQVKVFHRGRLGNRLKNETDDPNAWKEIAQEEFGSGISVSEMTSSKYYELWDQKVKEDEARNGIL